MEYKSTSLKSVIGNVIRNTGTTSGNHIESMKEWIPEAMALMQTQVVLGRKHIDLDVEFYKAKLPCGLVDVLAVEYGGRRLRHYSGERTFSSQASRKSISSESYISTPKTVTTTTYTRTYVWTLPFVGTRVINAIFYDVAGSSLIDITVTSAGSLVALLTKLNSLGLGVFTAQWTASALVITTESIVTDFLDITFSIIAPSPPTIITTPVVTISGPDVTTNYSQQAVDIRTVQNLPVSSETYYTELDWLNTSFCDGQVRLYFTEIPLDCDDLPLIPDNQNYKQALYWYVRSMMIGAGHKDLVFSFEKCMAFFEVHAARAIGEITYPSVDQAMSAFENGTRLIFNDGAFDSFFDNAPESTIY